MHEAVPIGQGDEAPQQAFVFVDVERSFAIDRAQAVDAFGIGAAAGAWGVVLVDHRHTPPVSIGRSTSFWRQGGVRPRRPQA